MKIRTLIKEGEYRLTKAGVMDSKIDAETLFCYMTGWDKVVLFLKKEEEAEKETEEGYLRLIEKRASRIPLQHITGVQEFMGYEFKVGSKVLIPRQDTETLVTEAAKEIMKQKEDLKERRERAFLGKILREPPVQVLDMCCGSGAIGISLAKICQDISVTGTDISRDALEIASRNAKNLHAQVDFIEGDMFKALEEGKPWDRKGKGSRIKAFDFILSNPPYIKTTSIGMLQEEVKTYEPLLALDGGKDGLDFYRKIVDEAAGWLKPQGWLMMEIGHNQAEMLRKLIRDSGRYTVAEVVRDLPGKDRVIKCRKR